MNDSSHYDLKPVWEVNFSGSPIGPCLAFVVTQGHCCSFTVINKNQEIRMDIRTNFKVSIAVAVSISVASCAAGPPKTPPRPDKDNHIKLDSTARYFSDDGLVTRKVLKQKTWVNTLSRDFESVLSAHPEALSEAKKIRTYSGIATGGAFALLAISIKSLADTLEEADDVDEGRISDSDSLSSNLGPLIVATGVLLFAGLRGKKVLKNSVDIYNKKQDALLARNGNKQRIVASTKPQLRSGYFMSIGSDRPKETTGRKNYPHAMANWSVQF